MSLLWNKQGTSVLIKTAVDVDTTGSSYYGEQNLHFLSSTGSSSMVSLCKFLSLFNSGFWIFFEFAFLYFFRRYSIVFQNLFAAKKGPIYDAAWASNSIQFCVVFGFMPAKASIFNLKCDPIFEFGPTPKNVCFFNPHVSYFWFKFCFCSFLKILFFQGQPYSAGRVRKSSWKHRNLGFREEKANYSISIARHDAFRMVRRRQPLSYCHHCSQITSWKRL